MKSLVSTFFHVICFPHDGRIVTIDQLSFISPDWVTSLSGSYMQIVSPPLHVNYVVLSPMTSNFDDLDSVVDMVITEISSTHGDKNSTSSNSNEVIHDTELISQHSRKVKNYTK
jgi:hypothetical protein